MNELHDVNNTKKPKVSLDAIVGGRDFSSVLDYTADSFEAARTSLGSEGEDPSFPMAVAIYATYLLGVEDGQSIAGSQGVEV